MRLENELNYNYSLLKLNSICISKIFRILYIIMSAIVLTEIGEGYLTCAANC